MEATRLTAHHFKLVQDRFVATASKLHEAGRKVIHKEINPLVALRKVFEHDEAWIVGGYLVLFNIQDTWWSDDLILAEQLVFALEPETSFGAVIEFFEAKAREAGAGYICVGTALAKSDKALASLYIKHGFSQMAVNLAKEVT